MFVLFVHVKFTIFGKFVFSVNDEVINIESGRGRKLL